MLANLSSIAKGALGIKAKVPKLPQKKTASPTVEEAISKSHLVELLGSPQWGYLKQYINQWLLEYQVKETNQIHVRIQSDAGSKVIARHSGRATAAKDFWMFINNLKTQVDNEVKGRTP